METVHEPNEARQLPVPLASAMISASSSSAESSPGSASCANCGPSTSSPDSATKPWPRIPSGGLRVLFPNPKKLHEWGETAGDQAPGKIFSKNPGLGGSFFLAVPSGAVVLAGQT
jgi:hypothetical protein